MVGIAPPYHIKANVYEKYVLSVMLHGLECMNWTTKLLQKFETFQNHIMWFMTNKRLIDHTKITDLLTTTKLTPITPIIKSKTVS